MCLYPRLIRNPRYKDTGKYGAKPRDPRMVSVPIGCGVCKECLDQKRNNWLIRLQEDIQYGGLKGYMVTLTFSEEAITKLQSEFETGEDTTGNDIAKLAVKRFLERWRKKYKKSIKHWLITEHGHINTERIHLHGVLFTDINILKGCENKIEDWGVLSKKCELAQRWMYGQVHVGKYCNAKTINYIIKYVTKRDKDHPGYVPKILCSPGIGKTYTQRSDFKRHVYRGKDTETRYKLKDGRQIGLPIYYRNKAWTPMQREDLWMITLDKNERWVLGVKIDISRGEQEYYKRLEHAQKINLELGYASPEEWRVQRYRARREEQGLAIKTGEMIISNLNACNYEEIIYTFEDHITKKQRIEREKEDEQWRKVLYKWNASPPLFEFKLNDCIAPF